MTAGTSPAFSAAASAATNERTTGTVQLRRAK
jgi:hypothetical protein